jgi:predicted patatin/cPLA2 family phospholipase
MATISEKLPSIDHPVISEMVRRRERRASSGTKLGLVVEGGAMRGVVSGGALVALDEIGFHSLFDEVYAESAGAINACYFLSGQAQTGIRIYTEDLQTPRFLNPLRMNAIVNVDYVADVILTQRKPLDTSAVMASPSRLFVPVTNALDGSPRLVDVMREKPPLNTLLRATTAIVPLYNRAVLMDGVPYVDGGISNPIPIQSALDAGCTHILVLLTRPPEFDLLPSSGFQKLLLSLMLRGWTQQFRERYYTERVRRYRLARDLAFGRTPCAASVAVIGPVADSPRLSRTTLSPRKLGEAMADAKRRTLALFDLGNQPKDSRE